MKGRPRLESGGVYTIAETPEDEVGEIDVDYDSEDCTPGPTQSAGDRRQKQIALGTVVGEWHVG